MLQGLVGFSALAEAHSTRDLCTRTLAGRSIVGLSLERQPAIALPNLECTMELYVTMGSDRYLGV